MSGDTELKYSDLIQGIPEKRFVRAGDVKRLVSRLNKLSLIMQVSRSLMGAIDVKKLLSDILAKASIVMNADKASIFLIDEARNELYASVTLDGSVIRLPRGTGIIGFVADSGETVNIPDAYADARFSRDNDIKINYRTRAILCMPIQNQRNEIIGAIQILNKLDGNFFTKEDEEMLTSFTAMVGVCLENARAYEELAAEKNSLEDKVIERTAELEMAKAETDQILQAVEEGLFLLYQSGQHFIIGAEHSQALGEIFEQEELRSKNFLTALSAFLPSEIIDKTRLFVELMFDPKKSQAVLLKLNPLTFVSATFTETGKQKYLRFSFNRITRGEKGSAVDHLMATVSDVTHEIELRQKLERTEAENRRHMELLLAILQSEPATLSEFLDDLDIDLATATGLLEAAHAADAEKQRNLLSEFYRTMHSIKGNSSLLNFQALTQLAHQIESGIDALLSSEEILATQLSIIDEQLTELRGLSDELRTWLEKIALFQSAIAKEDKKDFLLYTLQNAIQKAAASNGKSIQFTTENFLSDAIPVNSRKPVKDLLVHLVRNAAIHGIEPPADRLSVGKSAAGNVSLDAQKVGNTLRITLEDDGRGIDGNAIARHLLAQNRITAQEVATLTESEKIRLIFRSGVSTHEGVSEFAGRGIGMGIVEENARKIGATISVETGVGKFTRLILSLETI